MLKKFFRSKANVIILGIYLLLLLFFFPFVIFGQGYSGALADGIFAFDPKTVLILGFFICFLIAFFLLKKTNYRLILVFIAFTIFFSLIAYAKYLKK